VPAGDRNHLVARDQLLGRGPAFFRNALVVLVDELDLAPEHSPLLVDHVFDNFDAVLHLRALHHGPGRRLGNADANLDRVGGIRGKRGRRDQRSGEEIEVVMIFHGVLRLLRRTAGNQTHFEYAASEDGPASKKQSRSFRAVGEGKRPRPGG
jgi:hypothetical protein